MILLHFGGEDWETTAYVNGKLVGSHKGRYGPLTFEITRPVVLREYRSFL